jgi:hypothetical protein
VIEPLMPPVIPLILVPRFTVGGMVEVDFGQFDILTSAFCSDDI